MCFRVCPYLLCGSINQNVIFLSFFLFSFAAHAAAAKSLQSCPTLRPHRRQPTRLPHTWDSPGKNTAVGCHSLLQCMKVKSESEVSQPCPNLIDPMDCSLPAPSSWDFPDKSTGAGCDCLLHCDI